MYLTDADAFNSDLFATCQVAKYNRFPPYLAKNFNNYLWFCIYAVTADDYVNKNINNQNLSNPTNEWLHLSL